MLQNIPLTKQCFKCTVDKPLSEFYRHSQMADGHLNKCKECNKKDVRQNFSKNREHYREYDINRQRFDRKRILQHRYTSLRQRTEGRAIHNSSATGKFMVSWNDFMRWHKSVEDKFEELYKAWEESGFTRKLAPSVDRKDNSKGYSFDNMQWLTQSDNSKKYIT